MPSPPFINCVHKQRIWCQVWKQKLNLCLGQGVFFLLEHWHAGGPAAGICHVVLAGSTRASLIGSANCAEAKVCNMSRMGSPDFFRGIWTVSATHFFRAWNYQKSSANDGITASSGYEEAIFVRGEGRGWPSCRPSPLAPQRSPLLIRRGGEGSKLPKKRSSKFLMKLNQGPQNCWWYTAHGATEDQWGGL